MLHGERQREAAAEINEDLVRNVLGSLGYTDYTDDDLRDILAQTSQEVTEAERGGQPPLAVPTAGGPVPTALREEQADIDDLADQVTGGSSGPRAQHGDYDEHQLAEEDYEATDEEEGHYAGGEQRYDVDGEMPAGYPLDGDGNPGVEFDSRQAEGTDVREADISGLGRRRGQPGEVYRAEQTYRHQQRFKPYVKLEKKQQKIMQQRQQQGYDVRGERSPSSQPPASQPQTARVRPTAQPPYHQAYDPTPEESRPRTHHDAMADMYAAETARLQQRLGVAYHHAPAFYSRSASNVIYSNTDDKTYLPRRAPNASKIMAAPSKRRSDVVKRGAAMRDAWKSDGFLSQQGRKDQRWNVRQSMLGGGMY